MGAVAASDAFFPFRDGLTRWPSRRHVSSRAAHPRRGDVAADEHGIALVFTATPLQA
ncbi:MAG: hypothetical protein ACLSGS_02500 [Adlercreutzia sp.]